MLARLDVIVRAPEKGDVAPEQSLALCTEGAELIRRCKERFNQAKQTVVRLQKSADGAPHRPAPGAIPRQRDEHGKHGLSGVHKPYGCILQRKQSSVESALFRGTG